MTNADVVNLVRYGDEVGREIDGHMARTVLGAKELLVREPANAYALQVVNDFAEFLRAGRESGSFAGFMLPHFQTDEEIAARHG